MNLYDILNDSPNLNITVSAGQLLQAIDYAFERKFGEQSKKESERVLTVSEVCQLAQVSRQTVHRWQKSGVLPFHKIGKAVRFRYSDVSKFLNGGD